MRTKEEIKEYKRKYNQEHKEELKIKRKVYMSNHPEVQEKITNSAKLRESLFPEVARRHKESSKKWRQKHPDKQKGYSKSSRDTIRKEVLTYYGNGVCACVKCGFTDIRALSIDHINNNGAEHRKLYKLETGRTSLDIYPFLKNNNYPNGYQTLCMNCQFIKKEELRENVGLAG